MKGILNGIGSRILLLSGWALLAGASEVVAQANRFASATDRVERTAPVEPNALDRGRYAILIDLDENRLYFKQGNETLWSAPVGTGTGMRVITDSDDWEFSTPTGRFQIQYKERDPVWIAPDWYFVENNLPVPPTNHPSRYMTGTLGVAAVYISPHLAIHGTNRPELLGQRVSHGCIRLENRYALRLYHNVQVGTEVIIVGGDDVRENARVVDLREGYDPTLASTGGRRTLTVDARHDSWKRMATDDLLEALEGELDRRTRDSRWDEVAVLLLQRAVANDDDALGGMLSRSAGFPSSRIEKEWTTFLAEAYVKSPVRTIEALSRLDSRQRRTAATQIVAAMLTLYNGDLDAHSAPWPTRRITAELVPTGAERGWNALIAAEREYRASAERATRQARL